MSTLLSDELKRFRAQFDGWPQTGITITGPAVQRIVRELNTNIALAQELEEATSRTGWNNLGQPNADDLESGNVVWFAANKNGGAT